MAQRSAYTVLPVSALQDQARTVFDTLSEDRTVYVSNRGKVVAAFRPNTLVPEAVAALYTSPNLNLPAVTARDLRRGEASGAVTDAAAGLPSLLTNGNRIHGILTAASTPEPAEIPDPDALGAKAEVMRQYRDEHPDATIDEVLQYSDSLDTERADTVMPEWEFGREVLLERLLADTAAVRDDLAAWRHQGSDVEDLVELVLLSAVNAFPSVTDRAELVEKVHMPFAARQERFHVTVEDRGRAGVIGGERFEAAGDVVRARRRYVVALSAGDVPDVGAMWRLADLARHQRRWAEAKRWYILSLVVDRLAKP